MQSTSLQVVFGEASGKKAVHAHNKTATIQYEGLFNWKKSLPCFVGKGWR